MSQADQTKQLIEQKKTAPTFETGMVRWYRDHSKRLITFSGSEDKARKLMAALFHSATLNPQLQYCDTQSVGDCLMQSAQLNLYPGALNECAFVPFKGKAKFVPMVDGLIKLAYNSGLIKDIIAEAVYEMDDFEYELGTAPRIMHHPFEGEDEQRGELVRVYCIVNLLTGGRIIKVKNKQWVDNRRKMSAYGNSAESPWTKYYEEMGLKAIAKYALKRVPKSPELHKALELDDEAEAPQASPLRPVRFDDSVAGKDPVASPNETEDTPLS